MGTERRRPARLRRAVLAAALAGGFALAVVPATQVAAASAWWEPLALAGTPLREVVASGPEIQVTTSAGARLSSADGGRTFAPSSAPPPAPPVLQSGGERWTIRGGTVFRGPANGSLAPDPGSPALGAGAHLLAAPAAFPGVAVAVAQDGTVWRRAQDGDWQRALLLLPAGLLQAPPAVTGVAAFTQPLSGAVYLSTDGYSVLVSTDGGDDWVRAGPGLPDSVRGLSADSTARALYAATSSGLFVHHLQMLPGPASYSDAALVWRWVGIVLVSAASALLAGWALLTAIPRHTPR